MPSFHDITMDSITGEAVDFANYKDTVCLVVNVASR
jgi:glutathione peroxidase-family protein